MNGRLIITTTTEVPIPFLRTRRNSRKSNHLQVHLWSQRTYRPVLTRRHRLMSSTGKPTHRRRSFDEIDRRSRHLLLQSAARLAAVIMVPQTLARLERFAAVSARVRTPLRVDPLVSPDGRRVLEPLAASAAGLVQVAAVLEQRVLLEMVALLEPDRADVTDERTLVAMRPQVVLELGVLRERLAAHAARPAARLGVLSRRRR